MWGEMYSQLLLAKLTNKRKISALDTVEIETGPNMKGKSFETIVTDV